LFNIHLIISCDVFLDGPQRRATSFKFLMAFTTIAEVRRWIGFIRGFLAEDLVFFWADFIEYAVVLSTKHSGCCCVRSPSNGINADRAENRPTVFKRARHRRASSPNLNPIFMFR
jgi:hypothetical protein